MPPKKKPVRNAYYFFMEKYRNDHNRNNPRNPITIKDAASLCSPLWQVYEDIAKKEKMLIRGMPELKYTTTGLKVSEVEMKEKELLAKNERMKEDIKNTVNSLTEEGFLDKRYFFIHANFFCVTDDNEYIPAELGISCFSLRNGVERYYHTMINPDILAFIVSDGDRREFPPLYTVNEFEPGVTNLLGKICIAADRDKIFKVYDLVFLFYTLKNKASEISGKEGFPVYCLAENEIENDRFAYTKEVCCYWHERSDGPQYCSLSRVRRWGFHLADHCCKGLPITLQPGQHLPASDKYFDDKPVEEYQPHLRKPKRQVTQPTQASAKESTSVADNLFQPLRQPRSMGVALSQALPKSPESLITKDENFPPLGRRIGINFPNLRK
ncbi:hypothetical protein J437_LFUL006215 [Ladona fulva]|uniref:HMG box domain-containing protein n=1 Tax=Ladona fulva TaxID=123851 RepID=A0A8K0K4X0_LADFU|nr:hypothetical protein J437_LFUL006215 [Ladona fulva]